jgi:hypothetical protein
MRSTSANRPEHKADVPTSVTIPDSVETRGVRKIPSSEIEDSPKE